ncbi:MAG: hypothetical protein H6821_01400 [Planctomycetaceae bacterium]|nr:hypothetical protein [Planctomycetaceae bacterium]
MKITCLSHLLLIALSFCTLALLRTGAVLADEPASLKLIPADAAFYSASTHLREQYDSLMQSRAVAKLREMPIVKMGLGMAQAKWNDPDGDLAPFKAAYEQPENQRLVEVLIDAVSHEVFAYGDEDFAALLGLLNQINQANQAAMRDLNAVDDPDAAQQIIRKLSQNLAQHLDKAKVPDLVMGFRLSDTAPAIAQLGRLEQVLGELLADQPELKQRLSRQQIAGGDFLTLQLDGSLIPWGQAAQSVPFDITEIREKVTKMTVSVAIGVKDNYLLVSVGDNNDHLVALGQGEVLASRKELAPLRRYTREQICSIWYLSDAFMKQANSTEQRLDQLANLSSSLLPLTELDPSLQQQIQEDVRGLVADIKRAIPESGAMMTFAFRNDQGYEGYTHNWGEKKSMDASQPLTILEHVGGDPILVVAGRRNYSPDTYDTISKWVGRALFYGETIGVGYLGPNEQDFYRRVRGDLATLVKQLDQINREKLVPAFRDGQGACVLDAKITSEQWHAMLLPSEKPLPMLELGLVYGVSDAGLVKEAATGYFQAVQKAIDTLHNAEPTTIPEFPLPLPDSREFPDGMVYYYRLPRELGLDKQLSPNAGLSEDTLVLSFVPKTTVRLLAKTPFRAGGLIEQHQGAAGAAFHFSFARLIDAVAPWVDYGIELSGQEVSEDTVDQIHVGLDIARCFREMSAVTYQQDGVWVTHFATHFEDLPE